MCRVGQTADRGMHKRCDTQLDAHHESGYQNHAKIEEMVRHTILMRSKRKKIRALEPYSEAAGAVQSLQTQCRRR